MLLTVGLDFFSSLKEGSVLNFIDIKEDLQQSDEVLASSAAGFVVDSNHCRLE